MVSWRAIAEEFRQHSDPHRAVPMSKYMQSRFPFLGINRPERDRLQKGFLQAVRKEGKIDWDFVEECWNLPEREYQYLAIDYLLVLVYELQPQDMGRLEGLIVRKSWWDTVDVIAAKLVGGLYAKQPQLLRENICQWASAENIWLRRTAILFQLKYKQKTDQGLLGKIITLNCDTGEFFIDKAIGWALREYSKTNPAWVREFMASHHLSALSVREGSKHIRTEI